jgi:hypothetical protein
MLSKPTGMLWLAAGLTVAVAALLFARLPDSSSEPNPPDPLRTVEDFAAALRTDAPYRPPDTGERRALVDALTELGTPALVPPDSPPGFRTSMGVDPSTGRKFAMLASTPNDERGWGLYLVDLSTATRMAIQVPHPRADLRTESLGVALFRAQPGAVLMVAGTHRRVANGAGDVAHEPSSMFHAVAEDQSRRGIPQVQLHGFEDTSLPDADVIISPGAGEPGPQHEEIVDRLSADDLRVCAAWRSRCGDLEGRTNEQGKAAAAEHTPFVHVELSRTTRETPTTWHPLTTALTTPFPT